jgi:hypothetical protein
MERTCSRRALGERPSRKLSISLAEALAWRRPEREEAAVVLEAAVMGGEHTSRSAGMP